MSAAPSVLITADEINCLIHAYLMDSGFQHAAYTLFSEAHLKDSSNFSRHSIPRGELVELLSKALLYVEVETHWNLQDTLSTNCKTPFSLLERHVCSLQAPTRTRSGNKPASRVNGSSIPDKRKASPAPETGRGEKRAKRDDMDVDVDVSKSKPKEVKFSGDGSAEAKKAKAKPVSKVVQPPAPLPEGPTQTDSVMLLPGHKTEVFVCGWHPTKPEILATGSKDAVVNLWDLPAGIVASQAKPPKALDHFFKADQGDLTALDWNSDGTLLAIGSYDSIIRICTLAGDLYFSNPEHEGPIFAVRFSRTGKWLVTASLDGTTCLWDVQAKRLHYRYRGHQDCCLDVEWIDDRTFGSCSADKMVHIMRVTSGEPIRTLVGHTNEINQIKVNPSRSRLASCSDDMTARIWDISDLHLSSSSSAVDTIPGLSTSSTPVVVLDQQGHTHSVSSIVWCPVHPHGTNELIATSSFDGTARIWDSETGACLKAFTDHKRPVYALAYSPNGRWLASGSGDGWLHIYNTKTYAKHYSWYAGADKPGVFEIDWQQSGNINRLALALECRNVGVIDVNKIPEMQD